MPRFGMQNVEGDMVDLYIPRKCHASNQLISAFDKAAIQISIADISADGTYAGSTRTFCIAGSLRTGGESDHAINHLCIEHGIIRPKTGRKTVAAKKSEQANVRATKKDAARGRAAQAPRRPRPDNKPRTDRKRAAPKDERHPRNQASKAAAVAAQ